MGGMKRKHDQPIASSSFSGEDFEIVSSEKNSGVQHLQKNSGVQRKHDQPIATTNQPQLKYETNDVGGWDYTQHVIQEKQEENVGGWDYTKYMATTDQPQLKYETNDVGGWDYTQHVTQEKQEENV